MHMSFHRFQHMALSLLFILQLSQNLPNHSPIATNIILNSIGKCRILIDDSKLSVLTHFFILMRTPIDRLTSLQGIDFQVLKKGFSLATLAV